LLSGQITKRIKRSLRKRLRISRFKSTSWTIFQTWVLLVLHQSLEKPNITAEYNLKKVGKLMLTAWLESTSWAIWFSGFRYLEEEVLTLSTIWKTSWFTESEFTKIRNSIIVIAYTSSGLPSTPFKWMNKEQSWACFKSWVMLGEFSKSLWLCLP